MSENSCNKIDCKYRINKDTPKPIRKTHLLEYVFALVFVDINLCAALYFFVTGSVRQSNSWSDSWDAYYCSLAVLPTSIGVAVCSLLFVFAFCALCVWGSEFK